MIRLSHWLFRRHMLVLPESTMPDERDYDLEAVRREYTEMKARIELLKEDVRLVKRDKGGGDE